MRQYAVIITRDITESCVAHVDAATPDEARAAAMEWLSKREDPEWAVDDAPANSDPYITDCTEE